jgi:hypothetical protein
MLELIPRGEWALPSPPDKVRNGDSPLKVALLSHQRDYHCVLLASLGFSYELIAFHTGLNQGQISYRLKKAGVQPRAYRQGRTELANVVIANVAKRAGAYLNHALADVPRHQ